METHCNQPLRRPTVVVVDDDAAVRNSLKFSLEIEGFAVCAYAAGADLLDGADLAGCSCLVIDQNMPGLNGLDLLARLRERRIAAPAILITGHANQAVQKRAATAGVAIVEKPFLGNSLVDSIRQMVSPEL